MDFLPVNQMMESLLRLSKPSKTDYAYLKQTNKIVPHYGFKSPFFPM